MRKAKRGLKRSEARRSGHRTYVHKQRPQDRLTSGAAFPREIRVRTTHFVSESASRAISSASLSPRRRGGADGGGGGPRGGEEGGLVGYSRGGVSLGGSWDGFGDGGGGFAWLNAGSWGTDVLQAMTDFARAGAESGVTASHARVLREWKQRYFVNAADGGLVSLFPAPIKPPSLSSFKVMVAFLRIQHQSFVYIGEAKSSRSNLS